jgi:hypothetical protein
MEEADESGDSVAVARTGDTGAVASNRGKEAMSGNQSLGLDHRFAIEDLLDEYLNAFKPGNKAASASERQETEHAAVESITAPEQDDQRCAASATG